MTVSRLFVLSAAAFIACNPSAGDARQAVGPEAFLRHVYAPYVAGNTAVDLTGNAAPMIFDPRLTALIRKDQAQPPGEIGALDQDPICDCQDFDRLTLLSVRISGQSADQATANVRLLNGKTISVLRYSLTKSKHGWRIKDIRTKDLPSLVAFLRAATTRP